MSMLTRSGTLVRKNRGSGKRSSVRRTRSAGSSTSTHPDVDDFSVPPSPITKFDPHTQKLEPYNLSRASPAKSTTATIVMLHFRNSNVLVSNYLEVMDQGACLCSEWNFHHLNGKVAQNEHVTLYLVFPVTTTLAGSFSDDRQLYETNLEWDAALANDSSSIDVFLQLQEANKEAAGACDFACRGSSIICKSTLATVTIALSMILPVVMISMGVKYRSDCPQEPRIPIYLLVGGCFGLLKLTINLWWVIQSRKDDSADTFYDVNDSSALTSRTYRVLNMLLNTFLLVWHILGTYWVFLVWEPRYTQLLHRPSFWCDRTVYMFTVIQIIGLYTFMCLWLVAVCLLTIVYRCNCVSQIDNV